MTDAKTTTELQNQLSLANWQLERAAVQNATLASENRRLRRMTANGGHGRILHRTAADARQIVGWRFANYSVSRRHCLSYGMSRRRWAWAVALLKLAGVLAIDCPHADVFQVDDLDECIRRIDKAVAKVEKSDDLAPLIFRLPKGAVGVKRKAPKPAAYG